MIFINIGFLKRIFLSLRESFGEKWYKCWLKLTLGIESWTCGQRWGARKPRERHTLPRRDPLVCGYVMCPEVKHWEMKLEQCALKSDSGELRRLGMLGNNRCIILVYSEWWSYFTWILLRREKETWPLSSRNSLPGERYHSFSKCFLVDTRSRHPETLQRVMYFRILYLGQSWF